jgi:nicotinate-nucleotide adenylyltransferase
LPCDQVRWIPSFAPLHKHRDGVLPFDLRLELLRAATSGMSSSVVDDIEGRLDRQAYTYDMLCALIAAEPAAQYLFVLGPEQFGQLHHWYRGRDLPALVDILVVARGGFDVPSFRRTIERHWPHFQSDEAPLGAAAAYASVAGRRVLLLPIPQLDISASLVRSRWMEGRDIRGLVADAVSVLLDRYRDVVSATWRQSVGADPPLPHGTTTIG